MLRIAWGLHLSRGFVGVVATPIAPPRAVPPVEGVTPGETATTALVAVAITVHFAHHRGGTLLVLVDAHRDIAQHVLAQAFLALDLGQRGRRRVEPKHREVRLAVLADAEG